MCCLNYKGIEVEGCELKLNRLTADKKLRKVTEVVAAQRNWSKKWQHVCHYNSHSFFFFFFFYCFIYFISDRILSVSWCGGCIFKEDSQQNHRPSLSAIITVSTLQWDMRPNPSPNPISSVTLIYFVIFNSSFLTKVSCWRMYANCVWVCMCLYMADCKYKVWVR